MNLIDNNAFNDIIFNHIIKQLNTRKIEVLQVTQGETKITLTLENAYFTIDQLPDGTGVYHLTYKTKNNHPKNYDEIISMTCTSYTLLINLLERELITNQIFKRQVGD